MRLKKFNLGNIEIGFEVARGVTIPVPSSRMLHAGMQFAECEGYYPNTEQIAELEDISSAAVCNGESFLWDKNIIEGDRRPRRISAIDPSVILDRPWAQLAVMLGVESQHGKLVDKQLEAIDIDRILTLPAADAFDLADSDIEGSVRELESRDIVVVEHNRIVLDRPNWNRNKIVYAQIAQSNVQSFSHVRNQLGRPKKRREFDADLALSLLVKCDSYGALLGAVELLIGRRGSRFSNKDLDILVAPLRDDQAPIDPLLDRMRDYGRLGKTEVEKLKPRLLMARHAAILGQTVKDLEDGS